MYKNIFLHSILTSRGCPYRCKFCSTGIFGRKTRFFSPERVVSEIEYIIKNFPEQDLIKFDDDLFTINIKRLEKIVSLIKENKFHKKVCFSCNARINTLTPEVISLLREMNMNKILIGFESTSDNILKKYKGRVKSSQQQIVVDLCKKYGINITATFIVGFPEETKEEMFKDYWFIKRNLRNNINDIRIYYPTPFPNNELWDYVKNKGLIDENFSKWEILNLDFSIDRTIYLTEKLDKNEFDKIYSTFLNLAKQIRNDFKLNWYKQ